MTCKEFRGLTTRLGLPTAAEIVAVIMHTRQCPACLQFVDLQEKENRKNMTPEELKEWEQQSMAIADYALAKLKVDPELQDMMKGEKS